MFFIKETEVCNSVDDTTIYSYYLNYEEAHRKLLNDTHIFLNWFRIKNSMVTNHGKFQKMFLGSLMNNKSFAFIVENKLIKIVMKQNFWELPLTTNLLLQNI